jgi:hypothetical protein
MKKILVFLFSFACFAFCEGQNTFQKILGDVDTSAAYSVKQLRDSGYIIVGFTTRLASDSQDVLLVRTDYNGDTLWTKEYGGNRNERANSVIETRDGGFALIGYTTSYGAGKEDIYFIKTDRYGDTLWTRTYGGNGYDVGNSLIETLDSSYVICGTTNSFGAGYKDVYIIKLDSLGNIIWAETRGGSGDDIGYSVKENAMGSYYVSGIDNSIGLNFRDGLIFKINSAGNLEWERIFGGISSDAAQGIFATSDNGCITTGFCHCAPGFGGSIYAAKFSADGSNEWYKLYGGNAEDWGNNVIATQDGGYAIVGGTTSFGFGLTDIYFIKTDSAGDIQWNKTFGEAVNEQGYSVCQTFDRGYIIAGPSILESGLSRVYIVKTDSLGNSGCNETNPQTAVLLPSAPYAYGVILSNTGAITHYTSTTIKSGYSISTICYSSGINMNWHDNSPVTLSPNPFTTHLTIHSKQNKESLITLSDLSGKEILFIKTNSEGTTLNTEGIAAGLYFLRVEDGNGVRNYKVVKQ